MRKGASIKTWFPTLCAAYELWCTNIWVWMPLLKVFKQANTQGRTRRPHNKNFHAQHNFHKVPILPLLHMVYMVLDNGIKHFMLLTSPLLSSATLSHSGFSK